MTQIMLGERVQVISASNHDIIGLNGTIQDETKNMLYVRTKRGVRCLPKRHTHLRLEITGDTISDTDMRGRFYERTTGP